MNPIVKRLKEQGHDVSWYEAKAPRAKDHIADAQGCNLISRYLLEGDFAYTVNHDGTPYMKYKQLKAPSDKQYYCAGCKTKFDTWADIQEHIKAKREKQDGENKDTQQING